MNVRIDESAVRALRNRVYDHVISDAAWNSVRVNWLTPEGVRFLQAHDFPLATEHSQAYRAEHETVS